MRGQIAIEYLLVTGFVLLIMIPSVYFLVQYATEARKDVAEGQMFEIGAEIVQQAKSIFFFGEHSKVTIEAYIPEGVDDMKIQCKKPNKEYCEFIATVQENEVVFSADFPIVSRELESTSRVYTYVFEEGTDTKGKKDIILHAKKNIEINSSVLSLPCGRGIAEDFDCTKPELLRTCGANCCIGSCEFTGITCATDNSVCENYGSTCNANNRCAYEGLFIEMKIR